jgi:hypothetical protein
MFVMPSAASSAASRRWRAAFTGMAATAAILGALLAEPVQVDGRRMLHWLGKPLATVRILLLAWNRFHAAIPWASLWVLSTYYLALWWIARSVQRDDTLAEAGAAH